MAGAAAAPAAGIAVARDLAYGAAPQERLDVYSPVPAQAGAPASGRTVVIYVHGGAYQFGRRPDPASVAGNVGLFAARHGCVGIDADYRLAPAATWPAGAEDVGRMVAWAHAHARAFGGDPARIVLFGHSAGATHVAGYVFDRRLQPQAGPGIAGAILVSGRYVLSVDPRDFNLVHVEAYFGADPRAWPDRQPIAHAAEARPVPLEILDAGHENPDLAGAAASLSAVLCRRGGTCPHVVRLDGETHASEIGDLGAPHSPLGDALLAFLHRVAPG